MVRSRLLRALAGILITLAPLAWASHVEAQSLRGSRSSLYRQNEQAKSHDYSYLRTRRDVQRFVDLGLLVPVRGGAHYELGAVSFPYTRPEVLTFIERLARQYHSACGEKLVVTSLTRPETAQPRNASRLSVHPTGMALDLRRSNRYACRNWLEDVLLSLERAGLLEATRENYPPHYHVALFPSPYRSYVRRLGGDEPERARVAAAVEEAQDEVAAAEAAAIVAYQVRRGDSLWGIARRHGTTVDTLKQVNGLDSPKIYAGQLLKVPTR